MQFSKVILTLGLTVCASALPWGGGGQPVTKDTCSASGKDQVCCNGLGCLVQVLGSNCDTQSYCCDSGSGDSLGLVNVNVVALNCAKIL
eukprot:c35355_g1_i1 orf=82-348(+)